MLTSNTSGVVELADEEEGSEVSRFVVLLSVVVKVHTV